MLNPATLRAEVLGKEVVSASDQLASQPTWSPPIRSVTSDQYTRSQQALPQHK